VPTAVTTYKQCFDAVINTDAFKNEQTDGGLAGNDDDWDNFSDAEGWDFLEELETEYNCAGICYAPLWYMTRNINNGKPSDECLSPLFDDVFNASKNFANGFGAALLISVLCQLGLCGGMPATAGDEEEDNTVEYGEQPSGYGAGGMMRPGQK